MSAPEKGFFSFEVVPGPVFVSAGARKKLDAAIESHIEFVKENGPQDKCIGDVSCPYCEEMKREIFEETYGDAANRALAALKAREGEDIEEWAENLAQSSVDVDEELKF